MQQSCEECGQLQEKLSLSARYGSELLDRLTEQSRMVEECNVAKEQALSQRDQAQANLVLTKQFLEKSEQERERLLGELDSMSKMGHLLRQKDELLSQVQDRYELCVASSRETEILLCHFKERHALLEKRVSDLQKELRVAKETSSAVEASDSVMKEEREAAEMEQKKKLVAKLESALKEADVQKISKENAEREAAEARAALSEAVVEYRRVMDELDLLKSNNTNTNIMISTSESHHPNLMTELNLSPPPAPLKERVEEGEETEKHQQLRVDDRKRDLEKYCEMSVAAAKEEWLLEHPHDDLSWVNWRALYYQHLVEQIPLSKLHAWIRSSIQNDANEQNHPTSKVGSVKKSGDVTVLDVSPASTERVVVAEKPEQKSLWDTLFGTKKTKDAATSVGAVRGVLLKQVGSDVWQERYLVCSNKKLTWSDVETHVVLGELPLSRIVSVESSPARPLAFVIKTKTEKHCFAAMDENVFVTWQSVLAKLC